MKNLIIKDLYKNLKDYENKEITLEAWVKTVRASKNFGFIEINDGSFFKNVQVVFNNDLSNFNEISKLTISSSIKVTGNVIITENAKQPFEIHANNIEIFNLSDNQYPLQKKRHSFEYMRTIAHLRPRSNTFNAVFRVRSVLAYAIHQFFQERGFVYVNTPLLTSSDAEGAGEMFNVNSFDLANVPKNEDGSVDFSKDFFGKPAHLTVSGQLNAETYAMAFRNVYTFGPTFRAEDSNTVKHAAEFWMVEPEMAFIDINDNMDLAEDFLKYVIRHAIEACESDLIFLNNTVNSGLIERLHSVVNNKFVRLPYSQAIEILKQSNREFEIPIVQGMDLSSEHERFLVEEYFCCPIIVTDYPKEIKAFYMKLNEDGKTVRAMDILFPQIGEIIGGSERESDYLKLRQRMEELGMNVKQLWWYLETRKFGTVPHAGFGLGFERLVLFVTGMSNIRDVIPFPRTPKNANF